MSDRDSSVAFNQFAPPNERAEALAQLQKAHLPTDSEANLGGYLPKILEMAAFQFEEDANLPMNKAIDPNLVPYPSLASKDKKPGMQSVFFDQWNVNIQGDYWEKPTGVSFDALRMMVNATPVLNAVIMTRVRQVQRFCRVADSGNDKPGFEIKHIDRGHKLSKSEKENIQKLNRFIMNCGWEFQPRKRKALRRDSFAQFMAASVRDSLTMDSAPIELEWKKDMALGIDGFYAIDGSTIRLCTENGYGGDDEIFALQLVEGRISTAYSFADLIYEARNPRADVRASGYGYSETELLIRVVTGYINAMTYNIKGFDSNSIPKGMLHLNGNYSSEDLKAFKMYWNSMVKGINNQWNLPVMVSKDQESKASFERFGIEFNEMYFSKWMTFLTSIICALYGMSPSEINFDSFSGGNSSPLSGSDTSEKLAASKDSGLRPLLAYYENLITDFIVTEFSPDYVFRWTGLDPEDADKKFEMRKLILTVNEARAEEGHEAMDDLVGNAPLNPSLIPLYQQENQPEEPEQEPPTASDGTYLDQSGRPINESGHLIGSDGQPLDQSQNQNEQVGQDDGQPKFGDESRSPDFGKSFNLPIYRFEDM